jgi:hypothetical protein
MPRQPSLTGAILSGVSTASFFIPYALAGSRPRDQISQNDPYYNPADYAQDNVAVNKGNRYKADLSYNTMRGLLAYKDDNSRNLLFQFNPTDLDDTKQVIYEDREKTGFDNTDFLWIRGGSRNISFTLFLDATEGSRQAHLGKVGSPEVSQSEMFTHNPERGVLNQVEFLQSLCRPMRSDPNTPVFIRGSVGSFDQFTPPPEIVFVYGPFYLEGVVTQANPKYTLFSRTLVPLRATVEINIRVQEGQTITINRNLTDLSSQGFTLNQ